MAPTATAPVPHAGLAAVKPRRLRAPGTRGPRQTFPLQLGQVRLEAPPRMRKDMMDILACPVCKGPLTLTITREEGNDVIEGSLHCANCNETYPIEDTIP